MAFGHVGSYSNNQLGVLVALDLASKHVKILENVPYNIWIVDPIYVCLS